MRLGKLVVDLTPARASREFRLLLACRTIVLLSAGFIAVAAPVQVYGITGSSLQVGLVSLAMGVTLFGGFLVGGVLADRMDKRRLILISSASVAVAFTLFAINAAIPGGHQLTVIYVIVLVGGALEGIGETAITAATPGLVSHEHLAAASGLIAVTSQLGAIVGPALGGLVTSVWSVSTAYATAAALIVVSTLLLSRLRPLPPVASAEPDEPDPGMLQSVREGFAFVRGNRLIAGVLLIDLFATGFGVPQTLFPQMVAEHFHGGPGMVGLLAAAPAAGALIASITSGWTGRVRRAGTALIVSILVLAGAYIGFGLSPHLAVALVFLAVVGGADSISEILRRALLQAHTPNHLQGRVNSLWLAQASTSYSLGSTSSGFAAGLFGPAAAIVGAGVLCISSVAVLSAKVPELRRAALSAEIGRDRDHLNT